MSDPSRTETEDHVAIRRLQSAYADTVSRRAFDEFAQQFRPDATLSVGSGGGQTRTVEGPAAIGALIDGVVSQLELLLFVVLNAAVEVGIGGDPDSARARLYINEIHVADGGRRTDIFGVYHDRLERVDDRWWFAERHWRRLASTGRDLATSGFPAEFSDWL